MATENKINKFPKLEDFKKLIKKENLKSDELPEILMTYIEAVKYHHFQKQLKGEMYDDEIDFKLMGVYELANSIKTIIKESE